MSWTASCQRDARERMLGWRSGFGNQFTRTRCPVLGAGIVGVCAALELQSRGARVTLIDRNEPGAETSYGNAGVIARSSLMPMNNPGLLASLPKLLTNRTAALRYSIPFVLRNTGWVLGFLAAARRGRFEETTAAMDALIRLSITAHRRLMAEAGVLDRLNESGWIHLYRSEAGFGGARLVRDVLAEFGVATETLDRAGLRDLEPALKPVFERALWIRDTCSVDSPGTVVRAYAGLFAARGGRVERAAVRSVADGNGQWAAVTETDRHEADRVVVALGPWSRRFLEAAGMTVPMGYERGYHMHYSGAVGRGNARLTRPVYDTAGSYVLAPMEQGLRLTTGVELTDRDAPPDHAQLAMAEASARQAIALGDRLEDTPWLGRRPTMPDSRPVIGAAPRREGLFLAFGHQHVGFSTGPGTARVLADLIEGRTPEIPAEPFSPGRFIR